MLRLRNIAFTPQIKHLRDPQFFPHLLEIFPILRHHTYPNLLIDFLKRDLILELKSEKIVDLQVFRAILYEVN